MLATLDHKHRRLLKKQWHSKKSGGKSGEKMFVAADTRKKLAKYKYSKRVAYPKV